MILISQAREPRQFPLKYRKTHPIILFFHPVQSNGKNEYIMSFVSTENYLYRDLKIKILQKLSQLMNKTLEFSGTYTLFIYKHCRIHFDWKTPQVHRRILTHSKQQKRAEKK